MPRMTYEECSKQTGFYGLQYPVPEYKYFATVNGEEFEVTKEQSTDYKKVRKEQQDTEALREYHKLQYATLELWKKEFIVQSMDLIQELLT